ncbi:MAG: hypothetical protein ACI391_00405 [Muribaculaceae bacterium]
MKTKDEFTLKELEQMAQAYLNCKLSLQSEKELELVLTTTELSSPILNEARMEMGITSVINDVNEQREIKRRRYKRTLLRLSGVAACMAALITVASILFTPSAPNEYYYVSINGQELTGEAAKAFAIQTEARMQESQRQLVEHALAITNEKQQMFKTKHENK